LEFISQLIQKGFAAPLFQNVISLRTAKSSKAAWCHAKLIRFAVKGHRSSSEVNVATFVAFKRQSLVSCGFQRLIDD